MLVILASSLAGYYFAERLKERTAQLRALQMALKLLETEIVYGSTPLHQAFQKIGQRNNGLISQLFHRCAYYLQTLDGVTTFECWQAALQDVKAKLALKKDELAWLEHFGQIVGGSDIQDQTKHIKLMLAHFQKIEQEAKEEQKKYEKMYKTLGILTGVLLVILMI